MKKLYESDVVSKGGRTGSIKSSDGLLDFKVDFPKEMGGKGEGTNPEQLFAAAYASCFEQALLHMAEVHKIKVDDTAVRVKVSVSADDAGSFHLGAKIEVTLKGCDESDKLIKLANAACPYSKAVKGNIPVEVELV